MIVFGFDTLHRYDAISNEHVSSDASLSTLMASLFDSAFRPYIQVLDGWLARGELLDPSQQFFVERCVLCVLLFCFHLIQTSECLCFLASRVSRYLSWPSLESPYQSTHQVPDDFLKRYTYRDERRRIESHIARENCVLTEEHHIILTPCLSRVSECVHPGAGWLARGELPDSSQQFFCWAVRFVCLEWFCFDISQAFECLCVLWASALTRRFKGRPNELLGTRRLLKNHDRKGFWIRNVPHTYTFGGCDSKAYYQRCTEACIT